MNTKSRFCTRLVPLVIVTAVAGVLCGAQLLAVDFTQFDRVDVTVVNVDVVVTDRQGNPIPGLKATDFVLLENGEEVEISHFTAYSREPAAGPVVAAEPGLTAGAAEPTPAASAAEAPLTLVILVDNTSIQIQNRQRLLERLDELLASAVRPGDRVMVVSHDREIEVVTPLTDDLDAVRAGLAVVRKRSSPGSFANIEFARTLRSVEEADAQQKNGVFGEIRSYASQRYHDGLRSLGLTREWIGTLAGLPGRKAVVLFSDGFSTNPAEVLVEVWERKYGENAPDRSILQEFDLSRHFLDLGHHANANRVTLYSIGGDNRAPSATSAERGGIAFLYTPALESREENNLRDGLRVLATHTGGVAANGLGGLRDAIETLRSDFDTYYSLGFVPKEAGTGRDQSIKVRLRDPQRRAELRYREGYRDRTQDERLEDLLASALRIGEGENPLGVEMRVGAAQPAEDDLLDVPVAMRFPLSSVALIPEEGELHGRLLVFVSVLDDAGRSSPVNRIAIPVQIPRDQTVAASSQYAGYSLTLRIRPGRSRIGVVVRDLVAGLDSAASVQFDG